MSEVFECLPIALADRALVRVVPIAVGLVDADIDLERRVMFLTGECIQSGGQGVRLIHRRSGHP